MDFPLIFGVIYRFCSANLIVLSFFSLMIPYNGLLNTVAKQYAWCFMNVRILNTSRKS